MQVIKDLERKLEEVRKKQSCNYQTIKEQKGEISKMQADLSELELRKKDL